MKRYDKISFYFKSLIYIVIPLFITGIVFNGLMAFIPRIEGKTIDSLTTGDKKVVIKYVIIFICLVLFVQINRFFKRYLVRVFSSKMRLMMRGKVLLNLLNHDMSYFEKHSTGDILNRSLSDINDTCEGVRKMTTEVFDTIVLLVGYIVSLILLDYKVAVVGIIFCGASILIAELIKRKVYKASKEYKEYLSIHKQKTLVMLKNELYYRGYGVHDRYQRDYDESLVKLKRKNVKTLILQSSLEPLYSIVSWLGLIFIVYLSAKSVIEGKYAIGTFSSILSTYLLIAKKSAKVGKVFNAYQAFKISWVRVKPLLGNNEVEVIDKLVEEKNIVLKDFSYSYDNFNLPKFNLIINDKEHIGICGRVHSGKSTFLKSLSGIYNYDGKAILGGIELNQYNSFKDSYISFSSGVPYIFNDTLENNITLGKNGNLAESLRVSKLENDLKNIGGLDTHLSFGLSNLSGGQQMRLMLSRALYPNSNLILLDDPFKSVDMSMAISISENLKSINKTIIAATNNKNILSNFDKIIYLVDDTYYFDTYNNLLKIKSFKELMEG